MVLLYVQQQPLDKELLEGLHLFTSVVCDAIQNASLPVFSLLPRWTLLFDPAISAPAPQACSACNVCRLAGAGCSLPMHLSHSYAENRTLCLLAFSQKVARLPALWLVARVSTRAAADQHNQPALLRRPVT